MIKIVDGFDVSKIKEIVEKIEMKKCPFCGGDGEVVFYGPKYYMAGCSACAAEIHEHYFNPQDAAESWNNRYADQYTEFRQMPMNNKRKPDLAHRLAGKELAADRKLAIG